VREELCFLRKNIYPWEEERERERESIDPKGAIKEKRARKGENE
jgi:hypothetical protein